MKNFFKRVIENNMSAGDAGLLFLGIVIILIATAFLLHTMGVQIKMR